MKTNPTSLQQCKHRAPWLFILNGGQESQSVAKKLILQTFYSQNRIPPNDLSRRDSMPACKCVRLCYRIQQSLFLSLEFQCDIDEISLNHIFLSAWSYVARAFANGFSLISSFVFLSSRFSGLLGIIKQTTKGGTCYPVFSISPLLPQSVIGKIPVLLGPGTLESTSHSQRPPFEFIISP